MFKRFFVQLLLIFISVFSFFHCDSKESQMGRVSEKKTDFMEKDESQRQKVPQAGGYEKIMHFSFEEAVENYGDPYAEEEFILDESLNEFRIELYNFFPDKNYLETEVKIKEASWLKVNSKNELLTVWYTIKDDKWKPLHKLEWKQGSEF